MFILSVRQTKLKEKEMKFFGIISCYKNGKGENGDRLAINNPEKGIDERNYREGDQIRGKERMNKFEEIEIENQ